MSLTELPNFDSHWNFGNPKETEAKFREIFDTVVNHADDAYLAELETQIARTLGLQRRFDDAHAQLDRALARDAIQSGRPKVRYLLERGRVFNSSGDKVKALPLFIEAWEYGKELGEDGLAVDAAHMVAIVKSGESALEWNLIALDLATSSQQPAARRWRKSLHNNIGWTYFSLSQYEQAMEQFVSCREAAEDLKDDEAERIARWSIAKTHRLLGNLETALDMQNAQLAELESQGIEGGFVYEELAECHYALSQLSESEKFFRLAYEHLSQDPWLVAEEPERLARLHRLSSNSA